MKSRQAEKQGSYQVRIFLEGGKQSRAARPFIKAVGAQSTKNGFWGE